MKRSSLCISLFIHLNNLAVKVKIKTSNMAKNVGNFDFPENIVNRVKAMIVNDVVVLRLC